MASTKKSLTARVAISFGAVALATATALGGALPASAATPPNVDTAMQDQAELTIHKFAEPVVPLATESNGLPAAAGVLDGLTALDNVVFTATLVPGTDLTTAAGWALADTIAEQDDPVAYADGLVDSLPATRSGMTVDGQIHWKGLRLGVYLVEEATSLTDNITRASEPFLVSLPMANPNDDTWLYSVHVYPKNSVAAITKDVDETGAHELGETVRWTIDVSVPEMPSGEMISTFIVTDQLDSRLRYQSATPRATEMVAGVVTDVALASSHFKTTHADGLVTVEFTEAGRGVLSGLNEGHVYVDVVTAVTRLEADAPDQHGIIENVGSVRIDDAVIASDPVETRWGILTIHKAETDNSGSALEGAVFELYTVNPALAENAAAAPIETLTTGAAGNIMFPGLLEGTYWVKETVAPLGYQLPVDPVTEVSVVAGNAAGVTVIVENTKVPAYELPITGGTGQAAFMIGGFGLLAGALGFMLVRRRKAKADA
ncbi:LPXTG-motif cell wall anchor domain-containing protein/fimbrial isopeptide formation D2 domain-containing protein [Agrococcus baldri]|uniref:LPXTG-motif cell wall anchor domain-containing protein/fimbrial isopeptide formation D2 domain-containing protein n=1 Tax=Agrococcus baldri TaxID=153730 RepID=A0AA94HM34_9MICO|nr:SpaH/EbpB family LPXTG-anchored major pilin [Agrococcus baldri]SFS08377.1 LPXTG-motif cell wall anchor domain-containing protein/fimbrial isopeptide formation D2 domain-containing protein [Agrococcus baldri]